MQKKSTPQSAFFNLRALVAVLVCAAAACSILAVPLLAFFRPEAPANVSHRTLTFAERVAYQQAIEHVYWRHRIWPKERVVPNMYEGVAINPWAAPPAEMSPQQLDKYAKTVIPERLTQFSVFTFHKTYHFVDGYLRGMKVGNPFVLFGMTRFQIELVGAAYAPVSIIRSLGSSEPDETSVSEVDRALVRFLYGNRIDFFGKLSELPDCASSLPSTAKQDLMAINILTLIDRAAKDPEFENLRNDYDRLCEYIHPNLHSSFCLTDLFQRDGHSWIRIYRHDKMVRSRAVRTTIEMMAEWTDATIGLVGSLHWPFGIGPFRKKR
jgi:hypothetical protein